MILLLLACAHHAPPAAAPEPATAADQADVLARARAEAAPGAELATFSVTLRTPKDAATAQGTLLWGAPDHFRIELHGPIGPPVFVVVCDGHTLTAWNTMKGTASRADDAEAAVRGLTGGAVGLSAIGTLLVGRLPALDGLVWDGQGYAWTMPEGPTVTAVLDRASAHLLGLGAHTSTGDTLLDARFTPGVWPSTLAVSLPTLGTIADVRFASWEPVSPPDTAYTVTLPGSVVVSPFPTPAP